MVLCARVLARVCFFESQNEFKKWVNKGKHEIKVTALSTVVAPTSDARLRTLKTWNAKEEGVLIIG